MLCFVPIWGIADVLPWNQFGREVMDGKGRQDGGTTGVLFYLNCTLRRCAAARSELGCRFFATRLGEDCPDSCTDSLCADVDSYTLLACSLDLLLFIFCLFAFYNDIAKGFRCCHNVHVQNIIGIDFSFRTRSSRSPGLNFEITPVFQASRN